MPRSQPALLTRSVAVFAVVATVLAAGLLASQPAEPARAATGTGYLQHAAATRSSTRPARRSGSPASTGSAWRPTTRPSTGCGAAATWTFQIDQMASLGYNTLRVPFSNDALKPGAVANSVNDGHQPGPGRAVPAPDPRQGHRLRRRQGHAGASWTGTGRPAAGQSALWYTAAVPESTWIADWKMLAQRYAGNTDRDRRRPAQRAARRGHRPEPPPAPAGAAATRRGTGGSPRSAPATRSSPCNPNWLIFVEGVSCPSGGNANVWDNDTSNDEHCGWWGGNLSKAGQFPVRLSRPDRLVYSPHEYATSVYAPAVVRRPGLPRQHAGDLGPVLGLPGQAEHRPAADGRVRHDAARAPWTPSGSAS